MENMYSEYLNELQEKMDKLENRIEELSEALREDEDEFGVNYTIECIREEISLLQEEYDEYKEAGREAEE
jgi:prefoldin subunit 5